MYPTNIKYCRQERRISAKQKQKEKWRNTRPNSVDCSTAERWSIHALSTSFFLVQIPPSISWLYCYVFGIESCNYHPTIEFVAVFTSRRLPLPCLEAEQNFVRSLFSRHLRFTLMLRAPSLHKSLLHAGTLPVMVPICYYFRDLAHSFIHSPCPGATLLHRRQPPLQAKRAVM